MHRTLPALPSRLLAGLLLALASTASFGQTTPAGYAVLDHYVAPVGQPGNLHRFAAPSGASLHETLNRWAAQAGWKLVIWQLPEDTDFTLGAARRFDGDVGQAAKALIEAIGPEANLQVKADPVEHVLVVQPAE